jgi:hypothetical protein
VKARQELERTRDECDDESRQKDEEVLLNKELIRTEATRPVQAEMKRAIAETKARGEAELERLRREFERKLNMERIQHQEALKYVTDKMGSNSGVSSIGVLPSGGGNLSMINNQSFATSQLPPQHHYHHGMAMAPPSSIGSGVSGFDDGRHSPPQPSYPAPVPLMAPSPMVIGMLSSEQRRLGMGPGGGAAGGMSATGAGGIAMDSALRNRIMTTTMATTTTTGGSGMGSAANTPNPGSYMGGVAGDQFARELRVAEGMARGTEDRIARSHNDARQLAVGTAHTVERLQTRMVPPVTSADSSGSSSDGSGVVCLLIFYSSLP